MCPFVKIMTSPDFHFPFLYDEGSIKKCPVCQMKYGLPDATLWLLSMVMSCTSRKELLDWNYSVKNKAHLCLNFWDEDFSLFTLSVTGQLSSTLFFLTTFWLFYLLVLVSSGLPRVSLNLDKLQDIWNWIPLINLWG